MSRCVRVCELKMTAKNDCRYAFVVTHEVIDEAGASQENALELSVPEFIDTILIIIT